MTDPTMIEAESVSGSTKKLPFEGLVVVELGARVGAAACGSLLAMAGATIIAVEPEGPGAVGKYKTRSISVVGKRSIVVRKNDKTDQALLRHALDAADVVLLSSDLPSELPVDWKAGADCIVCDITALAEHRPHSGLLCDKLVQALTGIAAVTGTAESTATMSDAAILDLGSGIYAAAAIAAALRVRRQHGGGQHIECSMYGAGINGLVTFLPFHFEGKVPPRGGNRHPMCAPWNAYEASDGWLLLCSANDDQWKRLCRVMDRPELGIEGALVKLADRVKRVDEVDTVVQAWIASKTVEEAVATLRDADIASGPIAEVAALPQDPNVRHRNMVRHTHCPERNGSIDIPGPPLTFGNAATQIPKRDADREFVLGLPLKKHPANANAAQVQPLAGLRVLEIGQYTTAPLAAKHMASLGAEVIKIEPITGEASRAWPPHLDGESYFFTLNNTNKRSLALDLRAEEDRAVFVDLLKTSDVLVENLKPGSLARLGFSDTELRAINPRLVYCAVSGYGADSIYPGRPAFDTVIQAMYGLMDLTRTDDVPTKIGISIADTTGGMMGLFCILAMLEQREFSGQGSFIDLAMQDVVVWLTHTAWQASGRSPHVVLTCNDGEVAVMADHSAINACLLPAKIELNSSTRQQVADALMAAGIAAAPVRTVDEVGASERGKFIRMTKSGSKLWPLLELPFKLSRMESYELRPIEALGGANKDFARRTAS
jgi:crotonobetainyl-CoA:carnitine CoA-transferase CaiB-like acyl-CoA transferase